MANKTIEFLVMDVDGTLTDGKIYMGQNGEVFKAFNIKDGLGIHDILIPAGIRPIIITGRKSDIVTNRCREIGIKDEDIYQGVSDKCDTLKAIAGDLSKVAYIGDDLNDLDCMKMVKAAGGMVGCPGDAAEQVKDISDYIARHSGGDGAVRAFVEWLI